MKKLKKPISIMLVLLFVAGMFSFSASAASYNPTAAVNYAAAHWNDAPTIPNADCANFVSKCLTAGGVKVSINTTGSLYRALNGVYGTSYKLTLTNGTSGKIKASENVGKVSPGDPIFYYCNNCKVYPHVVICGGTNSSGYITVYGHTANQNNAVAQTWSHNGTGSKYCNKENMSVYAIHMNAGSEPVQAIKWDRITVSNITSNSAVVRADVTAIPGLIKTIGLQMWKDGESAKSVASWPVGSTLTYCSVKCDGTEAPKLSAGTKYNYRFYIIKTDGTTDYSGTSSFSTNGGMTSVIRWDKISATNITATSAVVRADVTAQTQYITRIGLQLWKDGESAKSVASWAVNTVLNYCSVACDGSEGPKLSPSTKYNYRFYISRTDGNYEYSSTYSFNTSSSTASVISWDRLYVDDIKETSAEVKTEVTANTSVIKTIGLQLWKENESVKSVASWPVKTILNFCHVKCDGTEAPKLSPGTKYYYRFYIIKTDGTYLYSQTSTFSTPCSHTYNSGSVTKSATCTETGVRTYTCTKCSATKTETINVLGHNYISTVVSPTCTEQGYTIHQCSRCTAGYKDTYTATKKHEYDKGTVVLEASCDDNGLKVFHCKNCGNTESEIIPMKAHSFGEWTITKQPTASAEGVKTRTCKTCGYKETQSIPKTSTDIIEENVSMNYKQSADLSDLLAYDGCVIESSNPSVVRINGKRMEAVGTGSADVVISQYGETVAILHINVGYSFFQWLILIFLFGWLWY